MMTDKEAAKRYGLTIKGVKFLRTLPGFDPFAQAEDGDYFDRETANRFIDLFEEHICHVKGSQRGMPFVLSPWEACILANVYGWYRADGERRFNEVLIYVPKKQGKSAFAAGWILIEMKYWKESGADFFSAASNRDQTMNVFDHVAGMCRLDEELGDGLQIYGGQAGNVKSVAYHERNNVYRCLSGMAGGADGTNPQMAVVDELHRHKNAELLRVLELSRASRTSPLTVITTTADTDRPSVCNDKLKFARRVLENKGDKMKPGYAPWFLPCVYETSAADYPGDKLWWMRRDVWRKANPNLGITVSEEFYRIQAQKCLEEPGDLNDFLRLHLNCVVGQVGSWLDMTKYDQCGDRLPLERFDGCECYGGLDLATRNDLAAYSLSFKGADGGIDTFVWHWLPEDTAKRNEMRLEIPFTAWADNGYITLTQGDFIDYNRVVQDIISINQHFQVKGILCDPWNAASAYQDLGDAGLQITEFRQGYRSMNWPTKKTEQLIMAGLLRHGGNPCLRWQFSNVCVSSDANENIKPDKKKSEQKIDGAVATIMSVAGWFPFEREQEMEEPCLVFI